MSILVVAAALWRFMADCILLHGICMTGSCLGISGKTQILFFVAYVTRFLDLFVTFVSYYNSFMKIAFVGTKGATIYFIYVKLKSNKSDETNQDLFRIELLLIPCALLSLVLNHEFSFMEILWTFSIYLEAVAILPQIHLLHKIGKMESIVFLYIIALTFYIALCLLRWSIHTYTFQHMYDPIKFIAGSLEAICLIYCYRYPRNKKLDEVDVSDKPESKADLQTTTNISVISV